MRHALLLVLALAPMLAPAFASAQVTTLREMRPGEVIAPGDLAVVLGHEAVARRLTGLSLVRALPAGAPVGPGDVAAPVVVARGERVTIAYTTGGLSLTATGRALNDAALGARVEVVNETSRRRIEAVAVGPGRVVAR